MSSGKPQTNVSQNARSSGTINPTAIGVLEHIHPSSASGGDTVFGGFPVFAVIGCWHQDQRKLADGPTGFAPFHAATPFLPFTRGGILQGLRELSPVIIVVGVGLTVAVRYFHDAWFGG